MVMLWNLVVLVGFVVERGGGQKLVTQLSAVTARGQTTPRAPEAIPSPRPSGSAERGL